MAAAGPSSSAPPRSGAGMATMAAGRRRGVGRGGGAPRCRLSAAPATGDGVARSSLPAWPG
uniref:Uncharacterized protein n=1 Tax=Oryza meridionalis TaxID=40149 RepID=A0A0E0CPM5_9ORYZ